MFYIYIDHEILLITLSRIFIIFYYLVLISIAKMLHKNIFLNFILNQYNHLGKPFKSLL